MTIAARHCARSLDGGRSPNLEVSSGLKRPRSSSTLCTPYREDKRWRGRMEGSLVQALESCESALLQFPRFFCALQQAPAMNRLSIGGRTNALYNLAKGMETLRPDSQDSRFPINRDAYGAC